MAVHPAPPPVIKKSLAPLAGPLSQPTRIPWGRLSFLIFILAVLISAGLILGWAWVQRAYPQAGWLRWLPSVTTTTIRERTTDRVTDTVPAAVTNVAASVAGVARAKEQSAIYTTRDVLGALAPLSSSGWLLGRQEQPGEEPLVVLPLTGNPQAVTARVADPASGFIFYKVKERTQPPMTIETESFTSGARVWVIQSDGRRPVVMERRIGRPGDWLWLQSDVQEEWWTLDPPVTAAIGSLVVNDRGRLLGLLGTDNRLWPADVVESALKQVFQQGTIERPSLGLSSLERRWVIDASQETASGILVGADDPAQAVQSGGAGERAGLRAGDILMEFDQAPIETDLFHALRRYKPGQPVAITYLRAGARREVTVELGTLRP